MSFEFRFASHPSAHAALSDIAAHRGWSAAVGALLMLLGAVAIAFPFAAGLAATMLLASILLIAGTTEIVHASRLRHRRGVTPSLVAGPLAVAVGVLLVLFPLPGVLSLTLVMAAYFLLNGALRIVLALQMRPSRGWGWLLFGGIVSSVLFVVAATLWPDAAVALLGRLLGIALLADGWSILWLARVAEPAPPLPA
jgi:uncharacterized membrane protein HdeD (DUF308 family)